jgi:hypothetical protein
MKNDRGIDKKFDILYKYMLKNHIHSIIHFFPINQLNAGEWAEIIAFRIFFALYVCVYCFPFVQYK